MSKNYKCQVFPGSGVVNTSPSIARGAGSFPGQGAKIPHTLRPKNQNVKQKQCCNRLNKYLKIKMVHVKKKNLKKKKLQGPTLGPKKEYMFLSWLFPFHGCPLVSENWNRDGSNILS